MAASIDKTKPYKQATGVGALIAAVFGVLYASGVELPEDLEGAVLALVAVLGQFVTAFTSSKAIQDAFLTPPPAEPLEAQSE